MNLFVKILLITFGLYFSGCRKEKYYDLPENIKQALLYYKYNIGDSVRYLRNNTDTLCFVVIEKDISYRATLPYSNFEDYWLTIKSTNSNYFIEINADVLNDRYDIDNWITIYTDEQDPRISVNKLKANYTTKLINGKIYSNVFLFYYDLVAGRQDTVYTSPNVGIIKACSDSLSLILLE